MSIPIKMMLEWLTHENAQLNRQVTDLQARGTELVEENRELKRRLAKYEQEALTAERWAEVLQALSPETQDGITDALLDSGGKWGTDPRRADAIRDATTARAEKAARDLAALHELIQEQSGLDEHHPNYSPEWAVRQMSERWGAEISARIVAERELADMRGRLREVEELMREMLTTLAEVCAGADEHAQAPWPWPLTRLAQELRRRVEKLEAERAR